MIKHSIPYITNTKAINAEQAAGFPPFSRGYSSIYKDIQLSNHIIIPDFKINDYSDKTIIDLFKEIISLKIIKNENLKLGIPLGNNIKPILYVIVFRTILSIIYNKLSDKKNTITFEFYAYTKNVDNELNTLIFAKAAQIDYLIVDDIKKWKSLSLLCPENPVDSLYGSEYLEQEIEPLFYRLWKQIEKFLP